MNPATSERGKVYDALLQRLDSIGEVTMATKDRESFLAAAVESQAMLVTDLDTGEILIASRPLEEMFGYYVRGELEGQNVDVLVPDDICGQHAAFRSKFARDSRTRPMGRRGELRGKHKDGHTFPVAVGLSSTMSADRTRRCAVAVVFDMSDKSVSPTEAEQ
jgi:PAS domain S-box-containing protein